MHNLYNFIVYFPESECSWVRVLLKELASSGCLLYLLLFTNMVFIYLIILREKYCYLYFAKTKLNLEKLSNLFKLTAVKLCLLNQFINAEFFPYIALEFLP